MHWYLLALQLGEGNHVHVASMQSPHVLPLISHVHCHNLHCKQFLCACALDSRYIVTT